MRARIDEIAVVLPSQNEACLLPRTLSALEEASRHLERHAPGVQLSFTVVLDCSTDASAHILASHPRVHVETVNFSRVGAARNAGITAAMSRSRVTPERLWIANTDADSVVPPHWLTEHHDFAIAGVHMLVGTVEPIHDEISPARLAQWHKRHQLGEGHSHVHGANLGLRADVFTALGGFPNLELGEDHGVVAKARRHGCRVITTDACRVGTSARLQGRVQGGFADFLAHLNTTTEEPDATMTSSPAH